MKTIFTTLFLFISSILSAANFEGSRGGEVKGNAKITGVVVDSTDRQPIAFTTIALNDPGTNKPIDGTLADENGKFTLNKINEGNYDVVVSFIGYKTKVIRVEIDNKKEEVDLGIIKLSSEVQLLNEVTIEGQKSLIEEKVDRTVYNAEVDQNNKGGDATDVLRKVPNLTVDLDGNVSIRGSQSIRVLINNRPSTIAANSVADALKQIPSDMIKTVEVITSPSAKYDAEGSAGIINIITKKNAIDGFSLGVDLSVGVRGSNLGLNGSFRKGKMSFSLGGHGRAGYNVRGNFNNSQETFRNDSTFLNLQKANTKSNMMFGRYHFGWDYDINKKNFLSASLQLGLRNFKSFQDNFTSERFINNTFVGDQLQYIRVADLSNTWDLNLNYIRTFDKPQKEFSILAQWSRNNRANNFTNIQLDESLLDSTYLKNLNDSYNQEITIQADHIEPINKKQTLELGAKQILRTVTSDYQYLQAGADGVYNPIPDRRLGNIFNYQQNISSGYASYTLNLPKNYSIKGGTRYEYTTINAYFENTESPEVNIKPYGVLVPSVNVSKKLKNGSTIKAAYNRRIQRPSLQFLNPNIQASNRLQQTIGNPDLEPEFTNNYELSYNTYVKASSVTLTGFMRNTTGAIQSLRLPATSDTITTTFRNIGNEDAFGMSIFANIRIGNKLMLNGGTDFYYVVLSNNVPDPEFSARNEGFVYNIRAFGSYNFNKGWGLQLFSFYRGNQVQLQGTQAGFGVYSLSVKKEFNNKRGSIGFGAENFFNFNGFKMKNEINSPTIRQTSTNVLYNMNFKVNFSYKLGKLSANDAPKRRKRSVNNDDLKDGGGDGQSGAMQQGAPTGGQGSAPSGGQAPAGGGQWGGQKPGAQENKGQKNMDGEKSDGRNRGIRGEGLDSLDQTEVDTINTDNPTEESKLNGVENKSADNPSFENTEKNRAEAPSQSTPHNETSIYPAAKSENENINDRSGKKD